MKAYDTHEVWHELPLQLFYRAEDVQELAREAALYVNHTVACIENGPYCTCGLEAFRNRLRSIAGDLTRSEGV